MPRIILASQSDLAQQLPPPGGLGRQYDSHRSHQPSISAFSGPPSREPVT